MSCSPEQYNAFYNECLREPNVDRDEAIRRTNQKFGFGNTTAAQYPVHDEDLPPYVKPQPKKKRK